MLVRIDRAEDVGELERVESEFPPVLHDEREPRKGPCVIVVKRLTLEIDDLVGQPRIAQGSQFAIQALQCLGSFRD